MQNPFESGQIKNYLLFYGAVVLIMILFFIASTLFHDAELKEKKVFDTNIEETFENSSLQQGIKQEANTTKKFKLLEKGY